MSPKLSFVDKPTKLVVTANSLWLSKTNFRLIIYGHSSTNPANLAKIHLVDFEIIGVKGIVINK